MLNTLLAKIVGSQNERYLKKIEPVVDRINAFEPEIKGLSDRQFKSRTADLRDRVSAGETLDDVLPEAFALCREASRRSVAMRHYDVQLIGGMALHEGKIAEMKTGEGKTLVATLPVYLNALQGQGVHVVTVNDYLAHRDAEWMGPIYRFLGLKVGVIQHDMRDDQRQAAYRADITYGTNNEFGFDYLRDNMKYSLNDCVQRGHHFAIVDEVDSILIDEARTPLIISGPSDESTDKYYKIDKLIPRLVREEDYKIDEKARTVVLQESGIEKAERSLGIENLYDPRHMDLVHHIQQALKAHTLFRRDKDYMVKDGQVVIVDEFTGRLMPGRRYSEGLHQALEAKEGVRIERENQTLATITFQNYFRMYDKLSGMTGTAETEAAEFESTYKLDVVVIPTNRELIRIEEPDVIYRTEREKFNAIAEEIKELNATGQPILVGTTSIEKSERLSTALQRRGIKHDVLNAKYHAREAQIVAQAGARGQVTIATNMAGRGTDIILGGNPEFLARERLAARGLTPPGELLGEGSSAAEAALSEEEQEKYEKELAAELAKLKQGWEQEHKAVVEAGGLRIIGSERHEARRIDNQLRGRAGRQGDPGSSRFYLSLEDDLLRIFGSDNITGLMQRLGMEEGVPIESKLLTRQIERAQKQVEARNFEIRKHLLEYDDVMNKQREEIYRFRRELLEGEDQKEYVLELADGLIEGLLHAYAGEDVSPRDWDFENLKVNVERLFGIRLPEKVRVADPADGEAEQVPLTELSRPELENALTELFEKRYDDKEKELTPELTRQFERFILLQILDQHWKDHLLALDHLKEGIGLRGYGQRDPKIEYKRESFALFEAMTESVAEEAVRMLFLLKPEVRSAPADLLSSRRQPSGVHLSGTESDTANPRGAMAQAAAERPEARGGQGASVPTVRHNVPKVGRNEPCPCGSGKKFKKCCGG